MMNPESESSQVIKIKAEVIRVGVIHALSGDLSASENLVKEATLMAIAEINQSGGILGKIIEPTVVDMTVPDYNIGVQTRHLIAGLEIKNLFGCSSSLDRKRLLPILDQYQAQLWYPYDYEGLECSKNVFYTGACPNQIVQPAIDWLLQNKGDRVYLIGTDGIYSRTVNKIICAHLKQRNSFLLSEEYIPYEIDVYQNTIAKIKHLAPDAVITTLSPEHSATFYNNMPKQDLWLKIFLCYHYD